MLVAAASTAAAARSAAALVGLALVATALVWTIRLGRELYGRPDVSTVGYLEIALTCIVGAALVFGLVHRNADTRVVAAFIAGFGALYEGLTMLPVLTHAVALSALPTAVVRTAEVLALGAGVGVLVGSVDRPPQRGGKRNRRCGGMNGPVSSTISSPSRSGRAAGIAAHAQAISKQGDSSVEAQQSSPPERHAPDREEVAEASGAIEVNDARRRVRPLVRMTRRTADADTRGDDDGEPVREQLEVHALRRAHRPTAHGACIAGRG